MRLNIYNNKDISDIPLTGNPQITYFKSVYRRHTHFIVDRHKQVCKAGNIANHIIHLGQLIKSIDLELASDKDEIISILLELDEILPVGASGSCLS